MLCLSSCVIEDETYTVAYLKNATVHQIVILPYRNGVVLPTDTLKLSPDSTLKIGEGVSREMVNHGGFSSGKFSGDSKDSTRVVFDKKYSISHYVTMPTNIANKHYDYSSLRNIVNYLSYDYTYENKTKHSRRATYRYTFTDSDYVYAIH